MGVCLHIEKNEDFFRFFSDFLNWSFPKKSWNFLNKNLGISDMNLVICQAHLLTIVWYALNLKSKKAEFRSLWGRFLTPWGTQGNSGAVHHDQLDKHYKMTYSDFLRKKSKIHLFDLRYTLLLIILSNNSVLPRWHFSLLIWTISEGPSGWMKVFFLSWVGIWIILSWVGGDSRNFILRSLGRLYYLTIFSSWIRNDEKCSSKTNQSDYSENSEPLFYRNQENW